MELTEINGEQYSAKSFKDYKLRVYVEFMKGLDIVNIEIYTTETDKSIIQDIINENAKESKHTYRIIYWATRANDDRGLMKFNKWLNKQENHINMTPEDIILKIFDMEGSIPKKDYNSTMKIIDVIECIKLAQKQLR